MTNSELKKKISESINPEWFRNVEEKLNFHYINYSKEFVGVSTLFEFLNQQIKGWEKYGDLPNELNQSLNYFKEVKEGIITFINSYSQTESNRNHYWQQYVTSRINNVRQKPLIYSLPEVEYLVKVSIDYPNYFPGAFEALINNQIQNPSNRDSLYGAISAFEFLSKDFSSILERRNSEKRSIIAIRNDFENYLNESEKTLSEHLANSNDKFSNYVEKIDKLTSEKEEEFYRWYDNIKTNDWEKWYNEKLAKLINLEETYEAKLKLEKPARYWEKKSTNYYKQANTAKNILIGVVGLSILFLATLLLTAPEWIFENIFKGNEIKVIRWSLIFIVLISIIAYAIRAITKYMFSSYHLARDAEERHTLTFFYLALLKDTDIKDEERQMILQSLFSRTDTGLLKEDSSPTMPSSDFISKIITNK